jgi:hypothetical protein
MSLSATSTGSGSNLPRPCTGDGCRIVTSQLFSIKLTALLSVNDSTLICGMRSSESRPPRECVFLHLVIDERWALSS